MKRWRPPVIDPTSKLERAARQFHRRYPQILEKAEEITATALEHTNRCGIAFIWERLRWFYAIESKDELFNPDTGKPFKLNNNHKAYYARWMLMRNPEWVGRIRIRRLRVDGHVH